MSYRERAARATALRARNGAAPPPPQAGLALGRDLAAWSTAQLLASLRSLGCGVTHPHPPKAALFARLQETEKKLREKLLEARKVLARADSSTKSVTVPQLLTALRGLGVRGLSDPFLPLKAELQEMLRTACINRTPRRAIAAAKVAAAEAALGDAAKQAKAAAKRRARLRAASAPEEVSVERFMALKRAVVPIAELYGEAILSDVGLAFLRANGMVEDAATVEGLRDATRWFGEDWKDGT